MLYSVVTYLTDDAGLGPRFCFRLPTSGVTGYFLLVAPPRLSLKYEYVLYAASQVDPNYLTKNHRMV